MPYLRPGNEYYATAVRAVTHGNPCVVDGVPGIGIVQSERGATAGLQTPRVAAIGEAFVIAHQGICQIDASLVTGVATKGANVYITVATDVLVGVAVAGAAPAGTIPFGKVVELAGQRGTPTGKIRINMNLRSAVIY